VAFARITSPYPKSGRPRRLFVSQAADANAKALALQIRKMPDLLHR